MDSNDPDVVTGKRLRFVRVEEHLDVRGKSPHDAGAHTNGGGINDRIETAARRRTLPASELGLLFDGIQLRSRLRIVLVGRPVARHGAQAGLK